MDEAGTKPSPGTKPLSAAFRGFDSLSTGHDPRTSLPRTGSPPLIPSGQCSGAAALKRPTVGTVEERRDLMLLISETRYRGPEISPRCVCHIYLFFISLFEILCHSFFFLGEPWEAPCILALQYTTWHVDQLWADALIALSDRYLFPPVCIIWSCLLRGSGSRTASRQPTGVLQTIFTHRKSCRKKKLYRL